MVHVSLTGSFNFGAAHDPDFRILGVLRAKGSKGIKRRGPQMTIDIIAFLGFVFTLTSLIAKAYERRQDVLYGPYIQGRNPQRPFEDAIARLAQAIKTSGLRRHFADIGWRFRGVSCLASAIIC